MEGSTRQEKQRDAHLEGLANVVRFLTARKPEGGSAGQLVRGRNDRGRECGSQFRQQWFSGAQVTKATDGSCHRATYT